MKAIVVCDACGEHAWKFRARGWRTFHVSGERAPRYVCPDDARKGYIEACFT